MRLIAGDALEFVATTRERFDVVFVDPPYGSGLAEAVLPRLPPLLAADALVYVESDRALPALPGWRWVKRGRAGAAHFCLIQLSGD